jgi:penicillin-binding protein 2
MGIDRFSSSLAKFGFGAPTGIDLNGEGSGVLPSREWETRALQPGLVSRRDGHCRHRPGRMVVTPIQLGQAVSIIAARGVRHPPHLLHASQDGINTSRGWRRCRARAPNIIRNPSNWTAVEEGMVRVVNTPSGTAHGLGEGFPYTIAGKTGSAERFSRTTRNGPASVLRRSSATRCCSNVRAGR